MSVPTAATYSAAALIPANTGLLSQLNGGTLKLRNAADALLATLTLPNPAGTVNGTTGVLTLSTVAGTVATEGTAAYGEFCQSDGTVILSIPTIASAIAVSGRLALNTLTLIQGADITLLPGTLG
jgi:hypothetical protein